jgi:hypothetical protein
VKEEKEEKALVRVYSRSKRRAELVHTGIFKKKKSGKG